MISYNKTWLANLRLRDQLKKELEQGNVTGDEYKAVTEKYPVGFYTPNLLPRIGFFVLTCIIVVFGDGLLTLMAGSSAESAGWFCFLSILSYVALELVVNFKFHYRSGVDDALLIISGLLFSATAYYLLFKDAHDSDDLKIWEVAFVVTLWLTMRFADMMAALICAVSFFAIFLYTWTGLGPNAIATAPFIMMIVSAFIFWRVSFYKNKKALINYQNCLFIAQIVSLSALYAAGNYYVVQILGNELKGVENVANTAIPLGIFFWPWTMLLPFAYIAIGIVKKNKLFLRLGLVLVAAALITYKNYFHLLPVDVEFTIAGAAILAIVYCLTQYLKTPKYGFTIVDIDEESKADQIKVESLLVAGSFSDTATAPANDGIKFGGGDFGGGGASGGF
jgi:hypothetical protein